MEFVPTSIAATLITAFDRSRRKGTRQSGHPAFDKVSAPIGLGGSLSSCATCAWRHFTLSGPPPGGAPESTR